MIILSRAGLAAVVLLTLSAEANAADCNAAARTRWAEANGYTAEAYANGSDCANAVVTLVVRGQDNRPRHVFAAPAGTLMPFAGLANLAGMKRTLGEWISQDNLVLQTAGKLPDWPEGANTPLEGEFPFYVDEDIDRDAYMKARDADRPLFCYVQGMESMACVALDPANGEMTKLGVQSFPG